jgi:hypothetical protein
MDLYCRDPNPQALAGTDNINQIVVEGDGPYRQEWTFKGEPQRIGMAYRIKYRYQVSQKNPLQGAPTIPVPLWIEDYILIGFEGSMGG